MSLKISKATAALLATGLFAFSSAAMATNGYFTHGVGTESKGMAGSGVGSNANMVVLPQQPILRWRFSPMRNGRSGCLYSAPCGPTRHRRVSRMVRAVHLR